MEEGEIISFPPVLLRALVPVMSVPPPWPNDLRRALPPETITPEGRVCVAFRGTHTFRPEHKVMSIDVPLGDEEDDYGGRVGR